MVKRPKRIDISLFTEELQTLINASAKIFPVSYEDVLNNNNPNNYEYVRVIDEGEHRNEIYRWEEQSGIFELIGADDRSITWEDVKNKPTNFSPVPHTHVESEITDLDKYSKEYIDNALAQKSDVSHNHDESYAGKYVEEVVENHNSELSNHEDRLSAIESGYSAGHFHSNLNTLEKIRYTGDNETVDLVEIDNSINHRNDNDIHVTGEDKIKWNNVEVKADKSYVDTSLAKKADATTLTGHIENSTIHVTQNDKNNWNNKADKNDIPTKVSELENDTGFITASQVPEGFTIYVGSTNNNADLWFKTI